MKQIEWQLADSSKKNETSAHLGSPFLGDEHVMAVQIAVLQPMLRQVRHPARNILPKREPNKRDTETSDNGEMRETS